MMHMKLYITLQLYRNRFFDSNIRRPNISLMIIICINEAYCVFGIQTEVFVLNISIMSKNRIHIKILINKSITNNNFQRFLYNILNLYNIYIYIYTYNQVITTKRI